MFAEESSRLTTLQYGSGILGTYLSPWLLHFTLPENSMIRDFLVSVDKAIYELIPTFISKKFYLPYFHGFSVLDNKYNYKFVHFNEKCEGKCAFYSETQKITEVNGIYYKPVTSEIKGAYILAYGEEMQYTRPVLKILPAVLLNDGYEVILYDYSTLSLKDNPFVNQTSNNTFYTETKIKGFYIFGHGGSLYNPEGKIEHYIKLGEGNAKIKESEFLSAETVEHFNKNTPSNTMEILKEFSKSYGNNLSDKFELGISSCFSGGLINYRDQINEYFPTLDELYFSTNVNSPSSSLPINFHIEQDMQLYDLGNDKSVLSFIIDHSFQPYILGQSFSYLYETDLQGSDN